MSTPPQLPSSAVTSLCASRDPSQRAPEPRRALHTIFVKAKRRCPTGTLLRAGCLPPRGVSAPSSPQQGCLQPSPGDSVAAVWELSGDTLIVLSLNVLHGANPRSQGSAATGTAQESPKWDGFLGTLTGSSSLCGFASPSLPVASSSCWSRGNRERGGGNLLSPEILLHLQQMHLYRGSGWQRALPALLSTPGSTPGISLCHLGHAQRLGFGSGRKPLRIWGGGGRFCMCFSLI